MMTHTGQFVLLFLKDQPPKDTLAIEPLPTEDWHWIPVLQSEYRLTAEALARYLPAHYAGLIVTSKRSLQALGMTL